MRLIKSSPQVFQISPAKGRPRGTDIDTNRYPRCSDYTLQVVPDYSSETQSKSFTSKTDFK